MHETLEARQVVRTVRRAGLNAYEAVYAPRARLAEHEHTAPFFTYVLRGEFVEQVGSLDRHSARGAVIFHNHHEAHANVVGPDGTASLNVEIAEEAWSALTPGLVGRPLSGDAEWLALTVWREFHHDDDAAALGFAEAVALLCAEVRRFTAREPHQRLDRCVEYLRSAPVTKPTLAEVARVAGVHPIHLAKLFRKRFGYSMGEFLRRQRIAWACEQLARDTGTISTIAARAGFADHAHFTRTFRRVTGCSPKWYRQHILTP